MKPYNTFKSIVFTMTTAIMFFFWSLIAPIITSNLLFGTLLSGIISLGTYRLVLKIAEFLIMKVKFIKKIIFGNIYLEGIWVGCFLDIDKKPNYFIEYYEQNFEGLIIRGQCYSFDNSYRGIWLSQSVVIDGNNGIVTYTYESEDIANGLDKEQGIAVFSFVRKSKNKAPEKLTGFSSNIASLQKSVALEIRVDTSLDESSLLERAKSLFENNKDFYRL